MTTTKPRFKPEIGTRLVARSQGIQTRDSYWVFQVLAILPTSKGPHYVWHKVLDREDLGSLNLYLFDGHGHECHPQFDARFYRTEKSKQKSGFPKLQSNEPK